MVVMFYMGEAMVASMSATRMVAMVAMEAEFKRPSILIIVTSLNTPVCESRINFIDFSGM